MAEADKTRRDFLYVATGSVAALGVAAVGIPVLGHMAPAADNAHKIGLEVDLSKIEEGQQLNLTYLGRPIAIRHRTPAEIERARADDTADLIHKETDVMRLQPKDDGSTDPRYLVFHPVCTHFGCVVVGDAGDYDGWYCPCHGAHFDLSGRVRKGPAPINMTIPNYYWTGENSIRIAEVARP